MISIFGSTGGSGKAALNELLHAGHQIRVLVRTPTNLVLDEESEAKKENLTIVQGDVRDLEKVKEVLEGTDVVISAIGSAVSFSGRFYWPKLADSTVCAEGINTIITAISQVAHPPQRLISVSTTGLSVTRDVPLLLVPLYHWLLAEPHVDKAKMEKAIINAETEGVIKEFIIVRAALLTDGPKTEKYRTGEGLLGYTVSRQDVGHFVAQNIESKEWVGRFPVIAM